MLQYKYEKQLKRKTKLVPVFGSEWYPRMMYIKGTAEFEHHVKTYGSQKDFGYKDFK